MRLSVEIDTVEDKLAFELFDATTLAVGITTRLPGKALLTFCGVRRDTVPGVHSVRLELGIEPDTSLGQTAAWLCERVAGRASLIRIDGSDIAVDSAGIERALSQHVRKPA